MPQEAYSTHVSICEEARKKAQKETNPRRTRPGRRRNLSG